MALWSTKEGYSGPLLDLVDDLLDRYHPRPWQLIQADGWIRKQIDSGRGPIPFRHLAAIRNGIERPGPVKPRYYYETDGLPFDAIATDNQATSSLYQEVLAGRLDTRKSMLQACQTFLCVGILGRSTPQREQESFERHGVKTKRYRTGLIRSSEWNNMIRSSTGSRRRFWKSSPCAPRTDCDVRAATLVGVNRRNTETPGQ